MADLLLRINVLEDINRRIRRRSLRNERYIQRSSSSVLSLSDEEFKSLFRVNRVLFSLIAQEVCPHLRIGTTRRALTPELKILVTLRFLAQGSYQLSIGNNQFLSVAQPTVSKILKEVINVMNETICPKYIQFPSQIEMEEIAAFFENKYRMPGIIGAIDCTHVRIVTPRQDAFLFLNRKHFYSLNVQLICDHKMIVRNVNANFPGCYHDSFIWQQSMAFDYCSQNLADKQFWLFGDTGYPLQPWLIVPFRDPTEQCQILFNTHHSSCQSISERCNGILKERWRCLKDIHGLHYAPEVASGIVNACVALHNLCVMHINGYADVKPLTDDVNDGHNPRNFQQNELYRKGAENRQRLVGYILQNCTEKAQKIVSI